MLSNGAALGRVTEAGVPIPQTIFACAEEDILQVAKWLGYPLLIKGDHCLEKGLPALPDLNFMTGIRYRRWLYDLRLAARRPGRILDFAAIALIRVCIQTLIGMTSPHRSR